LAAAGLTPKEAQTAMGHADIRTTLNIYAKAVPGWEDGATAKLDAFLGGPVRDSRATVETPGHAVPSGSPAARSGL
jgi:hypothetical protein